MAPRIVESGPIHIELSLAQAISMIIQKAGLEEELKELVKRALLETMNSELTKEVSNG